MKEVPLKIACIGDVDFISGFGLAGVPLLYLHRRFDDTLQKLRELFDNPEVGLILLPNIIAREITFELKELRKRKPVPLILTIPDKSGWRPEVDELRELIKRTVGAEVVFRGER